MAEAASVSDLQTALNRFDATVASLEATLDKALAVPKTPDAALTAEIQGLKEDRRRLESELGTMRAEAALLEAFTDRMFDKVDTAVSEIRYILED